MSPSGVERNRSKPKPGDESDDRARFGPVVERDGHRQDEAEIGHPSREAQVREDHDLHDDGQRRRAAATRPIAHQPPAVDVVVEVVVVVEVDVVVVGCVVVVVAIGTDRSFARAPSAAPSTNSSASKST